MEIMYEDMPQNLAEQYEIYKREGVEVSHGTNDNGSSD